GSPALAAGPGLVIGRGHDLGDRAIVIAARCEREGGATAGDETAFGRRRRGISGDRADQRRRARCPRFGSVTRLVQALEQRRAFDAYRVAIGGRLGETAVARRARRTRHRGARTSCRCRQVRARDLALDSPFVGVAATARWRRRALWNA